MCLTTLWPYLKHLSSGGVNDAEPKGSALNHPNLCLFLGASWSDQRMGECFIVSEYIEDGDLNSFLAKAKPSHTQALVIALVRFRRCGFFRSSPRASPKAWPGCIAAASFTATSSLPTF